VRHELARDRPGVGEAPGELGGGQAASPEQIAAVNDDLDLGERAAIAIAQAIGADLLSIEDAVGRTEAKQRSLRVTGTLGVLRAGAERRMIDVPDVLVRLRRTNFYVDGSPIEAVFRKWL